jgi:hypothetical protein
MDVVVSIFLVVVGLLAVFGGSSKLHELGFQPTEGPLARMRRRAREKIERELRKREVQSAERAARWAMWAAVIALVALAVSAWAFISPLVMG